MTKKTGVIIGILLMILAVAGASVCLLLPFLTSNRVSSSETRLGLISAGIVFFLGLLATNFSIISGIKAKRDTQIAAYKSQLQMEGVQLFDERLKSSITYLNFRRPGVYSGWRRVWFDGFLALTKTRLVALNSYKPVIDVPLTDERLQRMKFSLEGEDTLLVAFDANLFQPEWSGDIEYRFRTPQAQDFLRKLTA